MPDLIIKPAAQSGNKVIIQDQAGGAVLTTSDSGATLSATVHADNLVGMIAPFAMTSPPAGWIACDGSAISRTVTYDTLFGVIGTTWGTGNGSSTFNVPDLEGAFLRGTGAHASSNMANGNDFAGPSVGAFENDQGQGHTHTWSQRMTAGGNGTYNNEPISAQNGTSAHSTNSASNMYGYATNSYGTPRIGDETRPFNAGVKYCIKY